jgi:ABC-type glycerol-3-phosphate transport system substrate-binding protein
MLAVALVLVATALSPNPGNAESVPITPLSTDCTSGGRLVVAGAWDGAEATEFAKVLGLFQEQTGIQVVYAYETRDIATDLESLIKSGCVPDVALLPQPGTMADLVRRGALKPIGTVVGGLVTRNYSPPWRQLGMVNGTLYGVWFKAAEKSLIWYRPAAFKAAGIAHPPGTWAELLSDAARLRAHGFQPFAIGGQDGWTLTDWFENVYLQDVGVRRYEELAENRIKWTDPSVKAALRQLAEIFGDPALIGSSSEALNTTFEQSVSDVFGAHPTAAMVFEGDFVSSFLPAALPPSDAKFFAFPGQEPSTSPPVEVGGDVAVLLSNSTAGRRLIRFLATPAAGEVWARAGGFISPNRNVPLTSYPGAIDRQLAARVVSAPNVGFGISDQEPPAFGSDPAQGMWAMFQQFLAHPQQINNVTKELEAGATAAAACEQAVQGGC